MPKIALVVQRYGEEVNGGAELHARWLAEKLQASGTAAVTILTTCALDYTTWENHYPAGQTTLNGVQVHRYATDAPRNWVREQKETGLLLTSPHTLADEQAWMSRQGPNSAALLAAIQAGRDQYDGFIFITYHYAPAFYGLPLVADKAILVPTAHEDPFLAMPIFRPLFHQPRLLAYNTTTEQQLVRQITETTVPSIIVGIGIDPPPDPPDPARFRAKFGITGPFALYVGRVTAAKNVPSLLDDFRAYHDTAAHPLPLVLAGRADIPVPTHPAIHPLGFITEQDKFDAIGAAEVVIMPSLYESLSMIALEAWLMGKPMLVNGNCQVLKEQCRRSQGGLYYYEKREFAAALDYLQRHPRTAKGLGENGRAFVQANYNWDIILAKYRALFEML